MTAIVYARNEAALVTEAVENLSALLAPRTSDYEIIVADDASSDGTAEAAAQARVEPPPRVVRREPPPAYGALLREAFASARFPFILQTSASFRFAPVVLDEILALREECHIVVGHRRPSRGAAGLPPPGPTPPLLQRAGNWLYWLICRFVFGIPLRDIGCPLKFYRREIFERIQIQSEGVFADAEILAKAGFYGMMLGEVDVPTPGGLRSRGPLLTRTVLREAWRLFQRPVLMPSEARS